MGPMPTGRWGQPSVAAMPAAPDAEWAKRAGSRHPGFADPVDERRRRPLPESLQEALEPVARSLDDTSDGAIRLIGDPAL